MQLFKPLIGLCGYAQSGKDTVAAILVERFGYRRVAFADELRAMALSINPVVRVGAEVQELRQVVNEQGWDMAKQHPDVRVFLQNLGSTMRGYVSKDFWVQRMLEVHGFDRINIHTAGIVITDVRHLNEVNWLLDPLGAGVLWRINRPGVGPVNNHCSESEWTSATPDALINNDGTLDDLRAQVITAFEHATAFSTN